MLWDESQHRTTCSITIARRQTEQPTSIMTPPHESTVLLRLGLPPDLFYFGYSCSTLSRLHLPLLFSRAALFKSPDTENPRPSTIGTERPRCRLSYCPYLARRIPCHAMEAKLAIFGPRFDESGLDEKAKADCVKRWRDIIRQEERANPGWMKRWLDRYGPYALNILSDTQLAAVLGIPVQSLHRERLDLEELAFLVDVNLAPAALRFFWNNRQRKPERSRRRSRSRISKPHGSWVDYQPERKSPLRQVRTTGSLASPPPQHPAVLEPAESDRLRVTHSTPTVDQNQESQTAAQFAPIRLSGPHSC
ncbi:hypothetical protein F5144DRAFT_107014 [Chaetomium tenue]|uniref:Uncharacterized protein n=1 Tax=Chaetomium tenue TaxID=1854479 RepID=A0ACB7PHZ9_9PEZI|nr:hypothetical protein F5144DRAFT_107014 [Chaetomium globosum]